MPTLTRIYSMGFEKRKEGQGVREDKADTEREILIRKQTGTTRM